MNSRLKPYVNRFNELKARKKVLIEQIDSYEERNKELLDEISVCVEAKQVLSVVATATQKKFVDYIESLVTVALQSVYGPDLKFVVKTKENLECLLLVQEGDREPFSPEEEMGSGVLDIASLALRVAMWGIKKPASRNFIYLDEPMKAIGKGEMLESAIEMIRKISEELGIQFIINTHEPTIAKLADRSFSTTKEKMVSKVTWSSLDKEETNKLKLKRRS